VLEHKQSRFEAMKVFIEVHTYNWSVFIIVYPSHCLGGLTEESRVEKISQLTIQNVNKSLKGLHLLTGSNFMLKIFG